MPNYPEFAEAAGIGSRQMIGAIRAAYPAYSKATHSMVCHPDRYGVRLTDEAEAILRTAYGDHPGLASKPRRQRKKPVRTKPHRLVVYLPDDEHDAVLRLMEKEGFATAQELLRYLINTALFESEVRG